jgi:hypothetical protein
MKASSCLLPQHPLVAEVSAAVNWKGATVREPRAGTTEGKAPGRYEIRIKGHLHERWADWLAGLAFAHESNGTTNLHGPLADQAALHGVLNRIRDMGLIIVSVQCIGPLETTPGEEKS